MTRHASEAPVYKGLARVVLEVVGLTIPYQDELNSNELVKELVVGCSSLKKISPIGCACKLPGGIFGFRGAKQWIGRVG